MLMRPVRLLITAAYIQYIVSAVTFLSIISTAVYPTAAAAAEGGNNMSYSCIPAAAAAGIAVSLI
jgi:hypothetical protein